MTNSFDDHFDQRYTTINARTMVVHPWMKGAHYPIPVQEQCDEAIGLAHANLMDVIDSSLVPLASLVPATLIGKGKVEELGHIIREHDIHVVLMNHTLSPIQQRNLEKAWNCKVIDRTGVILEIFALRARTKEGRLQVELARLEYQKGRLVRTWTHLERQRGGFGFTGGPGERQIELDRRLISDRIHKLKKELSKVVQTRELHRKSRASVPYPVVALVGYTNAGKSTLFNAITGSHEVAEDKLFATLDPKMRVVVLPSGMKVILSDTVGFISDLPTELVAAFRATLEEVVEANLLLHVRNLSLAAHEQQKEAVDAVLNQLGLEEKMAQHTIEVYNKIDLLPPEILENLQEKHHANPNIVLVSALNHLGLDTLLTKIDDELTKNLKVMSFALPHTDGKLIAWIYEHSTVISREDDETLAHFTVRLNPKYEKPLVERIREVHHDKDN